RHTRFSRDWSSDVCSSDLAASLTCDDALRAGETRDRASSGRPRTPSFQGRPQGPRPSPEEVREMSTTVPTTPGRARAVPPSAASARRRSAVVPARLADRVDAAVAATARFLTRWSVPALRVALGLVFLGFGVLKLVPGASPA